MDFDLRWPLFLLANFILLSLLRLMNDFTGLYGLNLFLPALLLLEPALSFRLRWALVLAGMTGLAFDSYSPIAFGTSLISFAIVTTFFFINRIGLRRASLFQQLWVLLAVNFLLWLFMTITQGQVWLSSPAYWLGCIADLAYSSLLLFPIGYWFICFQRMLADVAGREFEAELEN